MLYQYPVAGPNLVQPRPHTATGRVLQALRRRLAGGKLRPGDPLPTEGELCAAFGLSRITIRRALSVLEAQGLIHRRPGRGTFVAPPPDRRITLAGHDYTGSVARQAPDLRRRLDLLEPCRADAATAESLQLPADAPVVHARRTDLRADMPLAFDDVYIPAEHAGRLRRADYAAVDFVERWSDRQCLRLATIRQTIEARPASASHAGLLAVRRGTPLLREVSVYRTDAGQPVGLFITLYRHDAFRVVSELRLSAC